MAKIKMSKDRRYHRRLSKKIKSVLSLTPMLVLLGSLIGASKELLKK